MTRTFLTDSSRRLDVPLEVPDDVIVVFESPKDRTRFDEVFHVSEDKGDTWRTLLSPYGDDGGGRLLRAPLLVDGRASNNERDRALSWLDLGARGRGYAADLARRDALSDRCQRIASAVY